MLSMQNDALDFVYDQRLVLRCQQGDVAALDELLARWQERLWRYARRLTGDSDAAWDVLQDAFLAVSQSIRGVENAASFRAWMYRIVMNKSMDWLRRRGRERRRIEEYGQQRSEEAPRESRAIPDLLEAVSALPGEEQSLLSMKYEAGLSTVEIAAVLGIPEGTVKSRLFTLRQKLRATMEKRQ